MNIVMFYLIFILLWVAFGGLIAGIVGSSWWKVSHNSSDIISLEIGLWKTCTIFINDEQMVCTTRQFPLKFKESMYYLYGF